MSDLISREELLDLLQSGYESDEPPCWATCYFIEDEVKRCPSIEAQPIVHGRWIEDENGFIRCSNCFETDDRIYGFLNSNDFEYCPWCGAKMDEVTE